jgi:erythronate-4-phosphate dehydrogenase
MKIVADPNIPFARGAFSPLGEVHLVSGRAINADVVRDASLLFVRSVTPVHAGLLDGSTVKFVATATIGTDHVDLAYLKEHGIGFASAEGSNANSVTEYVVAALLDLADRQKFRLRGRTLGVVGVGNIGARVARCAEALGMRVLLNDPPRQRAEGLPDFVTLEHLIKEADILTLHVPLNDSTHHLLHHGNLRNFMLINTARGAVVDNRALLRAIDGERIGGTVLDVWENEPDISPELFDIVDTGTPHIAGHSLDGKVNGTRIIYEAACKFLNVAPSWNPATLMPPPIVPRLELSVSSGEDNEDVLRRIVKRVYDISADDAALRSRPRDFEQLRAEYPVRREFFNTELVLHGASDSLCRTLAVLGFKTG